MLRRPPIVGLVTAGCLAFFGWSSVTAQNALKCYHCSEADTWCYGIDHRANESIDMNKAWWLNWIEDRRCAKEYTWCVTEWANYRFENPHGKIVLYNRGCNKNLENVADRACQVKNGTDILQCFCKTEYCNAHAIVFNDERVPVAKDAVKNQEGYWKIAYNVASSEKLKLDIKHSSGTLTLKNKGAPTVNRTEDEGGNSIKKFREADIESGAPALTSLKIAVALMIAVAITQ